MLKPYYQDNYVTIYHGDCREILPQLPKVDLMLTDPPYEDNAIGCYTTLADMGVKLLKDGKFLYTYTGVIRLPDVIDCFRGKLDWFWQYNLIFNGSWSRIRKTCVLQTSKPVLVYTRGKPKYPMAWTRTDSNKSKNDKQYHKWGQGITFSIEHILARTEVGELVLDPFLGGGTTAMACKLVQRKCIGIEIEEKYCEIAAKRCSQGVFELNV